MSNALQVIKDHEARQLASNPNYDPAADPVVRATGLGGSDMATVLGLNAFKSPLQLWAEKRGTWPEHLSDDVGSKMPVRIGKLVEDDICDMFAEDHDLKLHRYRQTARHDTLLWPMAHPDRRVVGNWKGKKACVEAKWTSRVDDWGEPGTDQIAEYYLPQVHQEMWLTDSDVCLVPVWLFQFRVTPAFYVVERDRDWDDILRRTGDHFWGCVDSGEEPSRDYNDISTQEAINKIYRDEYKPGDFVKLGADAQAMTDSLDMFNNDIKRAKGGLEAARARITEMMGTAQYAQLPDGRWWRRQPVDVKESITPAYSRTDQRIIKALPKSLDLYARHALRDAPALQVVDNREAGKAVE